MNSTLSQQTNLSAANVRGLYVLCVAGFPVIVAGLFTLMVFLSGAIESGDSTGHDTEFAVFNYPTPGDRVQDSFETAITLKAVPENESVYIFEEVKGKFWPKQKLGNQPGKFSYKHNAGSGTGYKFTIVLLSVNAAGETLISDWFKRAEETGEYPGLPGIADSTVLSRVRVIHQ